MMMRNRISRLHNDYDFVNDRAFVTVWKESARDSSNLKPSRPASLSGSKELELWLLRTGLSQRSGLGMSRIGIYTDFT